MRWTVTLEGTDEFGSAHWSQIEIERDLEHSKAIMAHLQQVIANAR